MLRREVILRNCERRLKYLRERDRKETIATVAGTIIGLVACGVTLWYYW